MPLRLGRESSRWHSTVPAVTPFHWPGFVARSPLGAHEHKPTHWPNPQLAMWDSSARVRLHWYPDVALGLTPRWEYACGRYMARPHRCLAHSQPRGTRSQDRARPTGELALFLHGSASLRAAQFLAVHA